MIPIEFAPLNIPLERRLQTIGASLWIGIPISGIVSFLLTFYCLFFTSYYWLMFIYLAWIYWDRETSERGGREITSVKNWIIWKYCARYFPIKLIKSNDSVFDPTKNYLFCTHPHGIAAAGAFGTLITNACDFSEKFPGFRTFTISLHSIYYLPFYREVMLSLGTCSSSRKSLNYILSKPDGGNVVVLLVGGAEESLYCRPGDYYIVLKNRKGFVKVALNNGSPIVPVFSFGEIETYSQVANPPNSPLRIFQDQMKKLTGIAFVIPRGRGFLQYSFGFLPQRRPINVVVGKPIDVPKISNPTKEIIEEYHQKYIKAITKLFEIEKHKYIKNHENIKLVIV